MDLNYCTPLERYADIWFKREDLFSTRSPQLNRSTFTGAKLRVLSSFAWPYMQSGKTLVWYGSRSAPSMVAAASATAWGFKVCGFCPKGPPTPATGEALKLGMSLHQITHGYPSVVKKAAMDFVNASDDRLLLPFGLSSNLTVDFAEHQALLTLKYLKGRIRRIVVVAGSGFNLAGVAKAHAVMGLGIPIMAVLVGKDCRKAVQNLVRNPHIEWVTSPLPYEKFSTYSRINGVDVDIKYEGKAIPLLQPGDLFWLSGRYYRAVVPVERWV